MNAEEKLLVAVANEVVPIDEEFIKSRIFMIRGVQVMLDRDLATLYGVTTKRLNEQVKRNMARFPASFRFSLSKEEMDELVANCDRLQSMKHSSVPMSAFTEHGLTYFITFPWPSFWRDKPSPLRTSSCCIGFSGPPGGRPLPGGMRGK